MTGVRSGPVRSLPRWKCMCRITCASRLCAGRRRLSLYEHGPRRQAGSSSAYRTAAAPQIGAPGRDRSGCFTQTNARPTLGRGTATRSEPRRIKADAGRRRRALTCANGTTANADEPLECDWGTSIASTGGRGMLLATAIPGGSAVRPARLLHDYSNAYSNASRGTATVTTGALGPAGRPPRAAGRDRRGCRCRL